MIVNQPRLARGGGLHALLLPLYTVKKGYRYSRLQLGIVKFIPTQRELGKCHAG
jgi:hypothetical protein